MDKVVILTGREQDLVIDAMRKQSNEFRQMLNGGSDDPTMLRIWRSRVREAEVVIDKVQHADLA